MTNRKTQMAMDIAAAKRKDPAAWDRVQERQDTIDALYKDIEKYKQAGLFNLANDIIQIKTRRENELAAILRILNS